MERFQQLMADGDKEQENGERNRDTIKGHFQPLSRAETARRRKEYRDCGDRVEHDIKRHDFIKEGAWKGRHEQASLRIGQLTETRVSSLFPY